MSILQALYKIISNTDINSGKNLELFESIRNSILYKNTNLHEEDTGVIFAVKADIQNDVYYLYTRNKENLYEKYNIAAIPNYKTSVMMNNIFRKIKENINLDALEESDDEEEFENIEDDKFVDLNKCVTMVCIYNNKYNTYKLIPKRTQIPQDIRSIIIV